MSKKGSNDSYSVVCTCGDAALHRVAAARDVVLGEAEGFEGCPARDCDLRLHDVHVCHFLGHGMLDLDPWVDFDEVVIAIWIDKKLHRPSVPVVRERSEADSVIEQNLTEISKVRRRGDFDDFLVPTLDAAISLEKVKDVALPVANDLNLDVPWCLDEALDEDSAVAKRRERFALRAIKVLTQI